MRLSTKSEYGLRAMAQLAQRSRDGAPVPLRELAAAEGISEPYLEQIFLDLRKAGFVQSVRGARGGYLLSQRPEEIRVGALLRVLEGDLAPYECVRPDVVSDCERLETCMTRQVWLKLRDAMTEAMDRMTLADIVAAGTVSLPS
jgi:Rrf2 family cysteine metabolism transcriptional repressor